MGRIEVAANVGGIEGLCIITPAVYSDNRGYFMEVFNADDYAKAGIIMNFVQVNQSRSAKGVLRGLHFQKSHPQGKLVRVIKGEVFDVAVDLRKSSPTYGKYYGVHLSASNKKQFLIPRGFAHGFLVLSDSAEFCYLCDEFYHSDDEGGIAWNDPGISISWPGVVGSYTGSASAKGYMFAGRQLNISAKDEKWCGIDKAYTF